MSLRHHAQITNVCHAVRRATAADARRISALYVQAYTPAGGGDPRDYYPFPQIMGPDGVAALIGGGDVVWLVGEMPDGSVVGSAAAMTNIGNANDRIAEVFGVAVEAQYRHSGLGSALVGGLVDELAGTSEFILCEARTDDAGGLKVARNAGFLPVGYEPYAHATPAGFESMVLTGRWRHPSNSNGLDGEAPCAAHRLREAVIVGRSTADVPAVPPNTAEEPQVRPSGTDIRVRRDDVAGKRWFHVLADPFDRRAGVMGLNPLKGCDQRNGRFTDAYYVAKSDAAELGAAWVFHDRTDARARVLGLRAAAPAARAELLKYLVKDLLESADGGRLVIIVLVSSTCSQAQRDLAELGFFPTAYLPALAAAPSGRNDVVQYTRLAGCLLRDSITAVTAKNWQEADTVMAQVLRFAP